ncbi:MAG: hypothetical protein AB1813_13545, partial [Verrucomicrobiota bacterium]
MRFNLWFAAIQPVSRWFETSSARRARWHLRILFLMGLFAFGNEPECHAAASGPPPPRPLTSHYWTGAISSTYSDTSNWENGLPNTGDVLSMYDDHGLVGDLFLDSSVTVEALVYSSTRSTLISGALLHIAATASSSTIDYGQLTIQSDIQFGASQPAAEFQVNDTGTLILAGNVDNNGSTFTLKESLNGSGGASFFVSGVIEGSGGLTIHGTSTGLSSFSLSGQNTYTGATTLTGSHAVLTLNGSIASSSLTTVNTGFTLKGTGTVGPLVLNSGAIISPGNSPGTLNAGNTTWEGGAQYVWEINQAANSAGADPGWDHLNITGSLTINATSENKFQIDLTSLTLGNVSGTVHDFNSSQSYTWTIATASDGISGFDPSKFTLNSDDFLNALNGGSFALSQNGNNLNLTFTPVPEPEEYALAAGIGLLGFAVWRRR